MKTILILLLGISTIVLGISTLLLGIPATATVRTGELFQYSTTDALLAGVFDGEYTVGKMLEKGDFGLGIFNGLDGELVVVDGEAYRLNADRTAERATDDAKVPFCSVCEFDDENAEALDVSATEYEAFEAELDAELPTLNYPYAIKVEGTFRSMTVRSTHEEKQPYAPISEIMERRVIMNFGDVEGVIVGFRCPVYLAGVNTAGYHFHFITADKSSGGHVMDFEVDAVTVKVMKLTELDVLLPDGETFGEVDFSIDRSQELENAHSLGDGH